MWKGGKGLTGVSKRTLYRVWAPKRHRDLKGLGPSSEKTPLPLGLMLIHIC